MKKRSFVYWGMFFILLSTLITPFLKLETGYAQTEQLVPVKPIKFLLRQM